MYLFDRNIGLPAVFLGAAGPENFELWSARSQKIRQFKAKNGGGGQNPSALPAYFLIFGG